MIIITLFALLCAPDPNSVLDKPFYNKRRFVGDTPDSVKHKHKQDKALGCTVVGTTHKEEKLPLLKEAGCDECILDDGTLRGKISGVTKALELVGIKTLKDTMFALDEGAVVCNTGVLGKVYEWDSFDPIKDIPNGVYLTGFFSNYPTQKMIQDIFTFIDQYNLKPLIGSVYDFAHIKDACIALDNGKVNGKIVVEV